MMDFTNGKIQFKLLSVFAPNFSKPKSSMSAINKCAQTIKQTIIGKGILGEFFPIYYDFCGLHSRPSWPLNVRRRGRKFVKSQLKGNISKNFVRILFPALFSSTTKRIHSVWGSCYIAKIAHKLQRLVKLFTNHGIEMVIKRVPRKAVDGLFGIYIKL